MVVRIFMLILMHALCIHLHVAVGAPPPPLCCVAHAKLKALCCIPQVSATAEYVLETRCTWNGTLCGMEVEQELFVERLFDLLAGSPDHVPQQMAKRAAPTALRMRLYHLCCTSATASNLSPRTLEVSQPPPLALMAVFCCLCFAKISREVHQN